MYSDDPYFLQFKENRIFQGFEEKEIRSLYLQGKEKIFQKGEYLMREGEVGNELFVILEGKVAITRYFSETNEEHTIDEVFTGDIVGELSLLDHGTRAASAKALGTCHTRAIPFALLFEKIEENRDFIALFLRIAENTGKKLRHANQAVMGVLKDELQEYQIRAKMGSFLMGIITLLSLFSYGLHGLKHLLSTSSVSTYVTFPITLIAAGLLSFLIRSFKMPLHALGITTVNLRRSLLEGFFFTIPIVLIGSGIKLFFMKEESMPFPFFDPYALIQNPEHQNVIYWLSINGIYCIFLVPLQELLARGALQGLLEKFLTNKHRTALSITMTSLIFSSVHLIFSLPLAIAVFFISLFLGWLYSRTHNLAGCCLSHAIIGILGFLIMGSLIFINNF